MNDESTLSYWTANNLWYFFDVCNPTSPSPPIPSHVSDKPHLAHSLPTIVKSVHTTNSLYIHENSQNSQRNLQDHTFEQNVTLESRQISSKFLQNINLPHYIPPDHHRHHHSHPPHTPNHPVNHPPHTPQNPVNSSKKSHPGASPQLHEENSNSPDFDEIEFLLEEEHHQLKKEKETRKKGGDAPRKGEGEDEAEEESEEVEVDDSEPMPVLVISPKPSPVRTPKQPSTPSKMSISSVSPMKFHTPTRRNHHHIPLSPLSKKIQKPVWNLDILAGKILDETQQKATQKHSHLSEELELPALHQNSHGQTLVHFYRHELLVDSTHFSHYVNCSHRHDHFWKHCNDYFFEQKMLLADLLAINANVVLKILSKKNSGVQVSCLYFSFYRISASKFAIHENINFFRKIPFFIFCVKWILHF